MAPRNEKLSRKLCVSILEMLASGETQKATAKVHHVTAMTVSRVAKMNLLDFAPTFEKESDDPFERLEGIRDQFLTLAEGSLGGGDDPLRVNVGHARQAAQSAIECHRYIEATGALPKTLNELDDEDARRYAKECWYQAARNGSPTAAAKLADALGVRSMKKQGARMEFDRPDPNDFPAASATSPGDSSKLH